jgi:hypothetical protein
MTQLLSSGEGQSLSDERGISARPEKAGALPTPAQPRRREFCIGPPDSRPARSDCKSGAGKGLLVVARKA